MVANTGAVRRPRVHRPVDDRPARAVVLQLPRKALPLRRRLHERPDLGCDARLRGAAGAVRPRVPHGRHRAGARARPDRVPPPQLGAGRRSRSTSRRAWESAAASTRSRSTTCRPVTSSGTSECVAQALRAIGWERRDDPSWRRPPDRPTIRRGLGFALSMQGSGIPFVDMGSRIDQDQRRRLVQPARRRRRHRDGRRHRPGADRGRGARRLRTEDILVYSADTDLTPFDVGAYASGTTYISGMAVKKAAEQVRDRIAARAAAMLGLDAQAPIELRDRSAFAPDGRYVTLAGGGARTRST